MHPVLYGYGKSVNSKLPISEQPNVKPYPRNAHVLPGKQIKILC